MVPYNFQAKFGFCSICSQKLDGSSLTRARKIFAAIARMLGFSITQRFVRFFWTEIDLSIQGTEREVQKRSYSIFIRITNNKNNMRN